MESKGNQADGNGLNNLNIHQHADEIVSPPDSLSFGSGRMKDSKLLENNRQNVTEIGNPDFKSNKKETTYSNEQGPTAVNNVEKGRDVTSVCFSVGETNNGNANDQEQRVLNLNDNVGRDAELHHANLHTGGANYSNEQGGVTMDNLHNPGVVQLEVHNHVNSNHHNGEHYHREEHHINQKVSNKNKIITSFLAGGFAGAIAKTTVAPLDRTKINFQTSNMKFSFRKAIQFLVMTYKKEGVRALWRGNSATMVRIVPYAAVQYTAHEQFKIRLNRGVKRKHLPPAKRVLAGSLAGITATTVTYPLDFARARMAITGKAKYRTLLDVFKTVTKDEGIRVIGRGYTPTVMGSCIYSGLGFFTYETLKIAHAEYTKGVDPTPKERLLFGAVAGIVGQCSSYPLDIIRRRMQTAGVTGRTADYTSVYRTAKNVYSNEGLKGGLYKGLSMNWVKGPIANGVSFMVFETVQRWLRRQTIFHIDEND